MDKENFIRNNITNPKYYKQCSTLQAEKYNEINKCREIPFYELIKRNVENGIYDSILLEKYTKDEIDFFGKKLDFSKNLKLPYSAIVQYMDKYLIKNKKTGEFYEDIQQAYMAIGMTLFANYKDEKRKDYVIRFYDYSTNYKITLPTPIVAGVRSAVKSGTSCVLIDVDDTIDSIGMVSNVIMKYTSYKAGLGINIGRIRAKNEPVRNGETIHAGLIPFLKVFEAATKSCTQGALRGGSATTFIPFWHPEILDVLVLKNNKGTPDSRVRSLDYAVQLNKLAYKRFLNDEKITLFSPNKVPDLLEAFYSDYEKFEQLYQKYENEIDEKIEITAETLFDYIITERFETGRIYIMNMDNVHKQGLIKEPISQSNLCMEITLPTVPIKGHKNTDGRIATCILAGVVVSNLENDFEFFTACDLLVRLLDELIDYQSYPFPESEIYTKQWRTLGIGFNDIAHFLAKNKAKYGDEKSKELIHEISEKLQYYCLLASAKLAEEKGACYSFSKTKYADRLLPIDTYNKKVDELIPNKLKMNWEYLRFLIERNGLRNCTLTTQFPAENSSLVGLTNGIEPPRTPISIKTSKAGTNVTLVPEYEELADYYTFAWELENNKGYLSLVAIMQKFFDQSISANVYYNPLFYEDGKVPYEELLDDILFAYTYGIKTLYYCNTYDARDEEVGCSSGSCSL